MSAIVDFNDTHKRHEALVVKVGAHAEVLTVTDKVVPLVNVNTILLVGHNLTGKECLHTVCMCHTHDALHTSPVHSLTTWNHTGS